MSDDKFTLITKEGLKKLKDELKYLKDTKRVEVAERLKAAIAFGDLSENSEYEEAKNEQAFIEGRIVELEEKIKNAKIIEEQQDVTVVNLGSTVVIRDIADEDGKEDTYSIVGSTEANPLEFKISNESPVGSALLGHKVGDIVKVDTPNGVVEYEILRLT